MLEVCGYAIQGGGVGRSPARQSPPRIRWSGIAKTEVRSLVLSRYLSMEVKCDFHRVLK